MASECYCFPPLLKPCRSLYCAFFRTTTYVNTLFQVFNTINKPCAMLLAQGICALTKWDVSEEQLVMNLPCQLGFRNTTDSNLIFMVRRLG